jgi:hypothetical protein
MNSATVGFNPSTASPSIGATEMPQTLTPQEESKARKLYDEFWRLHPDQLNPSDINTPEKATFLIMKGFERIALMQRARKQAYSFTRPESPSDPVKPDHWHGSTRLIPNGVVPAFWGQSQVCELHLIGRNAV